MNTEIATACAYRPEDRAKAVENQLLNAFDGTLQDLRRQWGSRPHDGELSVATLKKRHAVRARHMNIAIARVATRLAAAEVR